jgi:AAA domain
VRESNGRTCEAEILERLRTFARRQGKPASTIGPRPLGGPKAGFSRLGDRAMRPLRWLVPDFIPLGALTLLAADGGVGKSALILDVAARLSVGECCLGLGYDPPAPAQTLLVQCEDSLESTVLPRFAAAGGDAAAVLTLESPDWTLSATPVLDAVLAAEAAVRLVVIDPASAYVPREVSDHVDAEVRAMLRPLDEMAERRGVAVVLVKHLNKSGSANAGDLVSASRAYVNAARAAFLAGDDPADEGVQVLAFCKRNLTARRRGLAFRRAPLSCEQSGKVLALPQARGLTEAERQALREQLFRIQWLGETDVTARDLARARRGGEPGRAGDRDQEKAEKWLAGFLRDGPRPSADCVREGNQHLGSSHELKWWRDGILKGRLGGRPVKSGFGASQVWEWGLPEKPESPESPESPFKVSEDSQGWTPFK